MKKTAYALALMGLLLSHGANAQEAGLSTAGLKSYTALYTASLVPNAHNFLTGITGKMVKRAVISCTDITMDIRSAFKLTPASGEPVIDLRIKNGFIENKDALHFKAAQQSTVNEKIMQEYLVEAAFPDRFSAGTATFTKPEARTITLPAGTNFSTAAFITMLNAAATGKTSALVPVFTPETPDTPLSLYKSIIGMPQPSKLQLGTDSTPLPPELYLWSVETTISSTTPPNAPPLYSLGMRVAPTGLATTIIQDLPSLQNIPTGKILLTLVKYEEIPPAYCPTRTIRR